MDITPILILGSILISLGFTVFYTRRAENKTYVVLEGLQETLSQGIEAINTDLEPIIQANSRAMGVISNLSNDGKMDAALERRIGKDLLGQNEDILEMIRMAFPHVNEYIEEHPEAITKILPRLNTLISDPEARKRLNLDLSGTSKGKSRSVAEDWR